MNKKLATLIPLSVIGKAYQVAFNLVFAHVLWVLYLCKNHSSKETQNYSCSYSHTRNLVLTLTPYWFFRGYSRQRNYLWLVWSHFQILVGVRGMSPVTSGIPLSLLLLCLLSPVPLFVVDWTIACQASLSMGFFRKNTGVGCHFFLQGIFPTQGLKSSLLCLLHCREILYPLSLSLSPMLWVPPCLLVWLIIGEAPPFKNIIWEAGTQWCWYEVGRSICKLLSGKETKPL